MSLPVKTAITLFALGDPLNPTNMNQPLLDIDANINDINTYLTGSVGGQFENDPSTTTGLTFGYKGGRLRIGNTVTSIANGTRSLTPSVTSYVEISVSTGVITHNTTGFTNGNIPLHIVVTDATTVTTVTDKRTAYHLTRDYFDTLSVSKTLGTALNDTAVDMNFKFNTGTVGDVLKVYSKRVTAGADWTTASHIIQRNNGTTDLGFIEFGEGTSGDVVSLGKGSTKHFHIDAAGILYAGANLIWHSGNDGAGSGLDADLFDGNDSTKFVFGTHQKASSLITSFNSALKSGFYDGSNATGAPSTADYNLLALGHSDGSFIGTQFAVTTGSIEPKLFIRSTYDNGGALGTTAWRQIFTAGDNDTVGQMAYFGQNTAPNGWLKANGAAVSRTVYANLFAKIGTLYGGGDGSTTFNLPDMRGEFLRGWDDARGVDVARTMGSWQTDAYKSHDHAIWTWTIGGSGGIGRYVTNSTNDGWGGAVSYGANNDAQAVRMNGSSVETRPRNLAVLGCIKY